ncbi:MAG: adenylate/guanylate cyclase domain-containing protein [Aeromicrobium sp.]
MDRSTVSPVDAIAIQDPESVSFFDRLAERIYARSGMAFAAAALGVAIVNGVIVTACAVLTGTRYWVRYLDLTAPQATRIGIVAGAMTILALAATAAVSYKQYAPVSAWLAERTQAAAPAAWTSAAQFTPKMIREGVLIFTIAYVPVMVVMWKEVGFPLSAVPFLFLYIEFAIGFAAILDYFAFERLTLPMFKDLASFLPAGFVPPLRTPSLSLRIFSVITLVSIFTAITVAAFQPEGATLATTLAFMLIVPITVSLLLGLVPLLLLTQSVVGPIARLEKAVGRVEAGDLGVRAPVLSADNVGHLTGNFNRMVQGLRERAALHSAVGAYIDPAIAERVMAEGSAISGEAADVTVMFVDIVGYTAMAEHAEPGEVVAELNEFFDITIPVITRHGGHANKLLGDELMAVFGVPQALERHADAALAAAREVQARLQERYSGSLKAGIGLNSGTVVVGSMGGGSKLDYTIIGDVVNVASRVEAFTRQTGDGILLTDATRTLLISQHGLEPRGTHSLRGRATIVDVWAG